MYLIKAWRQTRELGSPCERWKVGGQVNPQGHSPRSPFGISIVGSTTGRSPATSQAGPGIKLVGVGTFRGDIPAFRRGPDAELSSTSGSHP